MTATKSEISFPDINDLSRLIRFQTDQGKIWLGEQRSILMKHGNQASSGILNM